MQEKDMVMDILSGTKASITSYAKIITECSNPTLRQTFQQLRNGDEQFQYDLYKIASKKGYYRPSCYVSQEELQDIKSYLNNSSTPNAGSELNNNINMPTL